MKINNSGHCGCKPPSYDSTGKDLSARQADSLKRIAEGLKSGALTQCEASGLMERQKAIAQHIQAAQADGMVDPLERLFIGLHQAVGQWEEFFATNNCARGNTTAAPDVIGKQADQLGRIANGITGGTLSSEETASLLGQQGQAARKAAGALWDGQVAPEERRDLTLELARASAAIFRMTS